MSQTPFINERTGNVDSNALRRWQNEFLDQAIKATETKRDFLLTATPGGGKTKAALAFAHTAIRKGIVDHVHVVTPTRALRQHWAEDTAAQIGVRLTRRTNNKLRNAVLPFDVGGVVTTYAQVAAEPEAHAAAMHGRNGLVIFDECHHSGDRKSWGEGIKDAFEEARFRLHLSGTPFRGDGSVIPFIRYSIDGVSIPDFPYTYGDAMADGVCRPVVFRWYNALLEYEAKGKCFNVSFSDDLPEAQLSDRLRFALHPDAGLIEHMVVDADRELENIRARGGRFADAAGLLVAMSIGHAYECAKIIKKVCGQDPAIIVSDSETAEDDLSAFRDGMGRWIIAVRMVTEGVDIPRLMVAVYATNVVATLFIRQFVGRVVRVRNFGMEEVGVVYMPGDERLIKEAGEIENEVKQFLKDAPPEQFAIARKISTKEKRKIIEVPKLIVLDNGAIYRGVRFTKDDLEKADVRRGLFPDGDRYSVEQIAYSLYRLGVGGGSEAA